MDKSQPHQQYYQDKNYLKTINEKAIESTDQSKDQKQSQIIQQQQFLSQSDIQQGESYPQSVSPTNFISQSIDNPSKMEQQASQLIEHQNISPEQFIEDEEKDDSIENIKKETFTQNFYNPNYNQDQENLDEQQVAQKSDEVINDQTNIAIALQEQLLQRENAIFELRTKYSQLYDQYESIQLELIKVRENCQKQHGQVDQVINDMELNKFKQQRQYSMLEQEINHKDMEINAYKEEQSVMNKQLQDKELELLYLKQGYQELQSLNEAQNEKINVQQSKIINAQKDFNLLKKDLYELNEKYQQKIDLEKQQSEEFLQKTQQLLQKYEQVQYENSLLKDMEKDYVQLQDQFEKELADKVKRQQNISDLQFQLNQEINKQNEEQFYYKDLMQDLCKELKVKGIQNLRKKVYELSEEQDKQNKFFDALQDLVQQCHSGRQTFRQGKNIMQCWQWIHKIVEEYVELKKDQQLEIRLIDMIIKSWNIENKVDLIPVFSRKLLEIESLQRVIQKVKQFFKLSWVINVDELDRLLDIEMQKMKYK